MSPSIDSYLQTDNGHPMNQVDGISPSVKYITRNEPNGNKLKTRMQE